MTRVMVFGTFDIVHKGHENFFQQARKLAKEPFLIVSVARDKNVKRIKGHKSQHSEKQRLKILKQHQLVDYAVLGGVGNYLRHIVKAKPEIIALGYDQTHYVKGLAQALKEKGLMVKIKRLKPFKPHLYKTSLLKKSSQK